jgi:hypothetical protein
MEVRYIIFSPEEVRAAVIALAQRQGIAATADDVVAVDIVPPNDAPSALLRLRSSAADEPIPLSAQSLLAGLILYCNDRRIPLLKRAEKRLELSINGLTLVLVSDKPHGAPVAASTQVAYGEVTTRATNELATLRQELSRAQARASHAEGLVAEADERARRAETARSKATLTLVSIANHRGLRGRLGRWLVRYSHP